MALRCGCCAHPQRIDLDAAIVRGESERTVADRFKVSKTSVHRHREHVRSAVKRAAVRTEAKLVRTLSSVLEQTHKDVDEVLAMARSEADGDLMLKALRERRGLAELEFGTKGKVEMTQRTVPATEGEELSELRELQVQMAARIAELEGPKGAVQ